MNRIECLERVYVSNYKIAESQWKKCTGKFRAERSYVAIFLNCYYRAFCMVDGLSNKSIIALEFFKHVKISDISLINIDLQ